jgi:hypothetical protein
MKTVSAMVLALVAATAQGADTPALGVVVANISDDVRESWSDDKIPDPKTWGVIVVSVSARGPAQEAGICAGDIIPVKARDKSLSAVSNFHEWVASLPIGKSRPLELLRVAVTPNGKKTWERRHVKVVPADKEKVKADGLRYGYVRIDERWVRLPDEVTSRLARGHGRNRLGDFVVGAGGLLLTGRMVQVRSSDDAIVHADDNYGFARDDRGTLRIVGLNTRGLVDDDQCRFDVAIAIVGTWKYTTVLGAGRTILLAVTVDRLEHGLSDDELAQLREYLQADADRAERP